MCFFVGGTRGSGRDYCLFGGGVKNAKSGSLSKHASPTGSPRNSESTVDFNAAGLNRHREPGLIRLAFETIIAQICVNKNAQFTIQLAAGLIQDEELEDLQAEDVEADSYARTARQTHLPNGQTTSECLTRKHCNNVKQLASLL